VVKGTEYFDAQTGGYVDFPVTDVMQMVGRAGRPQFDQEGKAVVLVHEPKKAFYHKFLHSPFPVESSLPGHLHNHLLAEIAQGAVASLQDAVDWLSWTFFFIRLLANPSYYGLNITKQDRDSASTSATAPAATVSAARLHAANAADVDVAQVTAFLLQTLGAALGDLERAGCVAVDPASHALAATPLGALAAHYYLDYGTAAAFADRLTQHTTAEGALEVLCGAREFAELPVRHNEDGHNRALLPSLRLPLDPKLAGTPAVKASVLLQLRWQGLAAPVADYVTDTLSVLAQAPRVLHAMVDACADAGWLATTRTAVRLAQMVVQGRWAESGDDNDDADGVRAVAGSDKAAGRLRGAGIHSLTQLANTPTPRVLEVLLPSLSAAQAKAVAWTAAALPRVRVQLCPPRRWAHTDFDRAPKPGKQAASKAVRLEVGAGTETEVEVGLVRLNGWKTGPLHAQRRLAPARVMGPRDVQASKEGWWIVVGDKQADEIWAMKKVSVGVTPTVAKVLIQTPDEPGEYNLEVFLWSDCYLGFDQVHKLTLVVTGQAPSYGDEEDQDFPDFGL
jgi:activating signal cointegrator complex subunit 3